MANKTVGDGDATALVERACSAADGADETRLLELVTKIKDIAAHKADGEMGALADDAIGPSTSLSPKPETFGLTMRMPFALHVLHHIVQIALVGRGLAEDSDAPLVLFSTQASGTKSRKALTRETTTKLRPGRWIFRL